MFKRQKIKAEKEKEENTFKQPTVKHTRVIETHLRERTPLEKIMYLFNMKNRRNSVFRMILDLKQRDLENNVFILADCLLNTLINDTKIDKMFYVVLKKLLSCPNSECINDLLIKYLKAQLSFSKEYYTFIDFIMRHYKTCLINHKEEILPYIKSEDVKNKLRALAFSTNISTNDYTNPFYYVRRYQ